MQDNITVYMKYNPDYSYCSERQTAHNIKLADISTEQAKDLEQALTASANQQPLCIRAMRMDIKKTIAVYQAEKNTDKEQSFTFHPLFNLWKPTMCGCFSALNNTPATVTRQCASNLAAGKCQDPFIRRTIGAVLFPEFYGKDKQK